MEHDCFEQVHSAWFYDYSYWDWVCNKLDQYRDGESVLIFSPRRATNMSNEANLPYDLLEIFTTHNNVQQYRTSHGTRLRVWSTPNSYRTPNHLVGKETKFADIIQLLCRIEPRGQMLAGLVDGVALGIVEMVADTHGGGLQHMSANACPIQGARLLTGSPLASHSSRAFSPSSSSSSSGLTGSHCSSSSG